jgi:hypothetical protein
MATAEEIAGSGLLGIKEDDLGFMFSETRPDKKAR